jgi:hypothetical protein
MSSKTPSNGDARQLQGQAMTLPAAYSPDDIALIKRTVAQGATDDELGLYLHDCKQVPPVPTPARRRVDVHGGCGPSQSRSCKSPLGFSRR